MISSTDPFPSLEQLPTIRSAASGPLAPDVAAAARRAGDEAHADGLRRGYEDGYQAGMADARADLSFALTALHEAIEDLHRRDAAGLATLSEDTVTLALAIAEAVIGREIESAVDPGRDALVRALALAPDRGAAVARFHPDDLARLGDVDRVTGGRRIDLVADQRVERGGCILDVGPARVDAQVGAAVERVRAELATAELARTDHELDGLLDHSSTATGDPTMSERVGATS